MNADNARLKIWVDRLDAFISALDAIDADDRINYCKDAWEIWRSTAISDPPPANSSAMLVVLGPLEALAHAMKSSTQNHHSRPGARNRVTLPAVHASLNQSLNSLRCECERWLHEGSPPADEIRARSATAVAGLRAATEPADGAAAADPYGAILGSHTPTVDVGIISDEVDSLTGAEKKRYREAYDRLRRMLDRELLRHISDESDALFDVLTGILHDFRANRVSVFDEDAVDELGRRIRSALISFTSALQIHRNQTIKTAMRSFGHDSARTKAVEELFNDFKDSSFEYRWLEELCDALPHGDTNAFRYQFTARRHGEPEVKVNMDREYMLEFIEQTRKDWLKRNELEAMTGDPSVLDMIKAIQPKVSALQGLLDEIMYPNVAEDVAVVKELTSRFNDRKSPWVPPDLPLAPRVLAFASSYDAGHLSPPLRQ